MKTYHVTNIGVDIESHINPILPSPDSPTGASRGLLLSLNFLAVLGLVGAGLLAVPALKADTLDSGAYPFHIGLNSIGNPAKTSDAVYNKTLSPEYGCVSLSDSSIYIPNIRRYSGGRGSSRGGGGGGGRGSSGGRGSFWPSRY